MFKTIKLVLPIVVFIILGAGALGFWVEFREPAVAIGGAGVAVIIPLLFYAVIRWDDQYESKEKEKRQLASVVDHALDAILVYDLKGEILYANPSACRSYGIDLYDSDSARPNIRLLGLSEEDEDVIVNQVLRGEDWNGEVAHQNKNGQAQIHLLNIFRLEEFQGYAPALVCIGRDLSQRKELERKLMHQQKLAAVGELAAGVAHEINNPMAAIQSQIGLAKDFMLLEKPPENRHQQVLDCIEQASHQVKRCGQIVESLLRFSRRQEPVLGPTRIPEAVDQAIKFLMSLPKMKNIEIQYEYAPDLLPVKSDANCISQILVNLMVNAADAMKLQGRILIKAYNQSTQMAAVEVLDHGSGIPPEDLERIFEPFFTTKPIGQGTGLGLSIAYGMAQSLGGELSLRCPAEGGTIATLTLPIHR